VVFRTAVWEVVVAFVVPAAAGLLPPRRSLLTAPQSAARWPLIFYHSKDIICVCAGAVRGL
jgi:hypothetical protein